MDLFIKWDENNYLDFISFLKSKKDEKYKEFHKKLLKDDNINVIGIRMPILRKIAGEIKNIDGFIKYNNHKYYEENVLHALVITKVNNNLFKYIADFIPYINNWAVNDTFANSLKQFKKIDIKNIYTYLESNNPWSVRFGLVLLLSHYITDKDIDEVLDIANNIMVDDYYVNMANAWLISMCYIKYKAKTIKFLKNTKINSFTYNKAISKICDSYRVSKEEKDKLKLLKREDKNNG